MLDTMHFSVSGSKHEAHDQGLKLIQYVGQIFLPCSRTIRLVSVVQLRNGCESFSFHGVSPQFFFQNLGDTYPNKFFGMVLDQFCDIRYASAWLKMVSKM